MSAPPLSRESVSFVVACAIAGALAVPANPVASPVSALIAGLIGFIGLRIWSWSCLPALLKSDASAGFQRIVRTVVFLVIGLLVGLLLLGIIRLVIEPIVPAAGARIAAAATEPVWRRLTIIYVAAVGEELIFRLLLVSVVTGLAMRCLRPRAETPRRAVIWAAIGLSALAFAAVHLPAWAAIGKLSEGLALMVMLLNSIGGIVFGYVFVRFGIVAAMWTHAGADCAIQLIGPLT